MILVTKEKVTKQLVKKGKGSLIHAPISLFSFAFQWIGVAFRHTFDPRCQWWYRIISPVLLFIIFGNILNITDLCFGDLIWTAITYTILSLGFFPEEKEELKEKWNEAIEEIVGQKEKNPDQSTTPDPQVEIVDLPASDFTVSEEKIMSSK